MELERRFVPAEKLELRAEDDGPATISGYSALFDVWTDIGPFMERVMPGTFRETRANDDIRALFNHDPNIVLGRTSNQTLSLDEDNQGLFMENTPPDTRAAQDVVELIRRGDITGQSYGFTVLEDEWETKEIEGTPVEHRTVTKVKLFDVGPVTYPAEELTSVQARSAEQVYAEHRSETIPAGVADEGGGDVVVDHDVTPQFTSNEASIRLKEYTIEMGC